MLVTKRDGSTEHMDIDKVHKVLEWAAEDLNNVSVSQVELNAKIQMFDGIKTSDIHDTLIKAAADLISEETPDYQYMAARLAMFQARKQAYTGFQVPHLVGIVKELTDKGLYDPVIAQSYSGSELEELNSLLNHDADMQFSYAAVNQLLSKYLLQDRVTGQLYESPQIMYMMISATLFISYPKKTRMTYVKRMYEALSNQLISLPTPIMSGLRTPSKQFSSCVLVEAGDSLDSISAASTAIIKYVSQRAGIGLNVGAIRALGSPIRDGEARHTGLLPFLKLFESSVKSCSQGGVRGGAATTFFPLWHLEIESLLVLKNNKGTEFNRVRHMDYGVQLNKLMYQRLIEGGNITLFSPHSVEGLYDAFFSDQSEFERLYLTAEQDDTIKKKTIKASELFTLMMQERANTGRIYIQNVDHCNTHSPFDQKVDPVKQSNLCMEIALPTKPVESHDKGEIALCTLAAFNLGKIERLGDIEPLADLLVRALDSVLSYQDYPMPQALAHTLKYRPLGVGVINYAYWLAKQGFNYSSRDGNNATHELFEAIQFYLLDASNALAKETYPCTAADTLKAANGFLCVDTYKKEVDELHTAELLLDWQGLRESIYEYGLRNATVSALMPSETSSQISNATNGIEPPRALVTSKQSKDGVVKQVVPGLAEGVKYETVWEMPNNQGYLEKVAIMQKFVCQSISANTNYSPRNFAGGAVPIRQLLADLIMAYRNGIKTLYYHNTRDDSELTIEDDGCESGACKL